MYVCAVFDYILINVHTFRLMMTRKAAKVTAVIHPTTQVLPVIVTQKMNLYKNRGPLHVLMWNPEM